MGLTTQHLKYHPVGVFGLVTSGRCPPAYISPRVVACACVENVLLWNVVTGQRVALLRGETSPVTHIALRPGNTVLAVGYQDGSIGMFELDSGERTVLLHGHKRAIQTLVWNSSGTRLASASLDTEIIVWDAVEESGLYRLRGHKEKVNSVSFLNKPGEEKERFLISVSSDRMIKIWDLDTQHCQVSNIHHKAQINTMVLMSDLVICASDDATLRFFKITWQNDEEKRFEDGAELQLEYFGSTNRNATDKTTFLTVSKNLLVAHGLKNVIDIWKFNDAAEVRKRQKKRVKKAKRKIEAADEENSSEIIINEEETIEDRLGQNISHKSGGKLRGLSMIHSSPQEVKIVAQHTSNQLQIHSLRSDAMLVENLGKLTLAGHRDSPLAVTFSSDNRAILTGSNDCVKVWAVETCKPVRTVETEPVTTLAYVRGDRQALIGTKTGKLLLVDIASADILEEKEAHEGEIWQIKSSKQDWATVGTDGQMKMWKLDFKKDSLTLKHTKTLQLKESILGIEFTRDKKFIAVALIDSTVKVFYRDTLKFWNSMYGHSLPVNCLAASDDSTLMATGSADRTVKIWGMDFADCHKSFVAHEKGVVSVSWVVDTHLFFSMGKDGVIKQWDADGFRLIQILSGHHDEINMGLVSYNGDMVCSVGKDKSIRLWERSEEVVVLEDEERKRREEEAKNAYQTGEQEADTVIPGINPDAEAAVAQIHPDLAANAAERLIDSIEIHFQEKAKNEKDAKHPILAQLALSSVDYVIKSINEIHQQELESALLLLPMQFLTEFMKICCDGIERRKSVERLSYTLAAVERLFFTQLTASSRYSQLLERCRKVTEDSLCELKEVADFNHAVLSLLQSRLDDASEEKLFVEAVEKKKKKDKRRKKAVLVV